MTYRVQCFIEKYIDLIEQDQLVDLYISAYYELLNKDIRELSNCLECADIFVSKQRELAIKDVLTTLIKEFVKDSSSLYSLPLKDFLEGMLDCPFGLDYAYIESVFMNYKDDWADCIDVFQVDGINVISKR